MLKMTPLYIQVQLITACVLKLHLQQSNFSFILQQSNLIAILMKLQYDARIFIKNLLTSVQIRVSLSKSSNN